MPPAKKAAKKSPKKQAKHQDGKHHHAGDLRRAFEHTGRLALLERSLPPSAAEAVNALMTLAGQQLQDGHGQHAADLLRASEHLSFAVLCAPLASSLSPALLHAIQEQFQDLIRRADEHWEEDDTTILAAIYRRSREGADRAFGEEAFHQALEFARCAEALAHVAGHQSLRLSSGRRRLRLDAA